MRRLPNTAAIIPEQTPGHALVTGFQEAFSYYLQRARHN